MAANIRGILLAAGSAKRFGSNKLLHALPPGTPDAGCNTVVCKNAGEGMGTSLAAGVRAAADAHGWVVALADMPFLHPETIRVIAKALADGAAIAAPTYRGERGHPVGFAKRYFDELVSLHGDHGARDLLKRHSSLASLHEVDDPGVLRDIDRLSDLTR